ncbi:hypothetical protein AT575_09095 [Streptococcus penaeicida]|uniref:Beta-carotene 15,15'-monooxygenase n=1 Tax=Streptococcus penaeicida TaxID=1765960 RepID=A0A2N8LAI1_9STRE|nr:DUF975 family protein [Streptococcus penaeicida]PND47160.1 hypothetical protein AT575_09095 [Streptococcus penaeicida]
MKSSDYKKQAKGLLKNLPGKQQLFFIPIIFIIALIAVQIHQNAIIDSGVQTSVFAELFPTLLNILASFFGLSATFTMLKVIQNKQREVSFNDLPLSFSANLFWKIIIVSFIKWLLLIVWSLLFLLGLALVGLGIYMGQSNGWSTALWVLIFGMIISLVGGTISINRQYAYSKVNPILFELVESGQYIGPADVIDRSVALTKGYKWKNFLLHLTFFGWLILIIFSFGLLLFHVYPYFLTSDLYFYEHLKKLKSDSLPH